MNKVAASIAGIAMLILVGCATPYASTSRSSAASARATQPVTLVFVAEDRRSRAPEIRAQYEKDLGQVVHTAVQRESLLIGDLIEPNTIRADRVAFQVDFTPPANLAGNTLYRRAWERKRAQEATAKAHDALYSQEFAYDAQSILGALVVGSRIFHAHQQAASKALVLFSPMIDTQAASLLDDDFRSSRVEATVARLKTQGYVPDLANVQVAVAGAGLSPTGEEPQTEALGWQAFWQAIFDATGARLVNYAGNLQAVP